MQVKWFKDCKTDQEKKKRQELVKSYVAVLDILSKICYNSISELESVPDYKNPAWAYEQANLLGQIKVYKEIIKMCNLDKDH